MRRRGAIEERTPATRLKTARELIGDAEVEAAALYLQVDGEKREALRRVLALLVMARNAIDG
jgi:hypothetical protein